MLFTIDPENTWVTADTHFEHDNIRKYVKRPFVSMEEQRETLISNWNSTVPDTATSLVLHLGDFNWGDSLQRISEINQRLHGLKYLVPGNHDPKKLRLHRPWEMIAGFDAIIPQLWDLNFTWGGKDRHVVLAHYASKVWNQSHRGSIMLYGHTHKALPEMDDLSMDVGVDARGFRPVRMTEILAYMDGKEERLRSEGKDPWDPWGIMKEKWVKDEPAAAHHD